MAYMAPKSLKESLLIFLILTLKLVAMAIFLERSEMEGAIRNLRSNTYHTVKIW